MAKQISSCLNLIRDLVINDYFTPNIKAEVILDTLLTDYVAEIIQDQGGPRADFVTKEMSVLDMELQNSSYGNMGAKIDYILANRDAVYLVELKTSDGSIEEPQARRYLLNCSGADKTFGSVFGAKLLKIVRDSFGGTYQKEFSRKFGNDSNSWNDQTLRNAYGLVFTSEQLQKMHRLPEPSKDYAKAARELLRKNSWAGSRKYLYTMGQLLDYVYPNGESQRTLWNLPLKLIYLTPSGRLPHEDFLEYPDFYWYPEYPELPKHPEKEGSVSLAEAGKNYLSKKQGDDLAQLLSDIICSIF